MNIRGNRPAVAAILSALAVVALTACTSATQPSAATGTSEASRTASASPTATPTAAAEPSTPAADGPLDARSAWEACRVVAEREYVAKNPGSEISPFSDRTTLDTDGDGTTYVVVGASLPEPVDGAGSMLIICTMEGTANAPVVVKWSMKDV